MTLSSCPPFGIPCQNQSGHPQKAAMDDKPMPSKLQFFEHIAPIIESYLKRYQTDKPMVPFMYYDLKDIVYVSIVGDHCFRLFQG